MRRVVWAVLIIALAAGAVVALRPRPLIIEMGTPVQRTVREYIAEEAKTRLAKEYVVDLPVSGTVERIPWEIGDHVEAGEVLARMDSYALEQQVRGLESRITQVRAQIEGVDTAKPKPEDLEATRVRVHEITDALRIAEKENSIAQIDFAEAEKEFSRAQKLLAEGVASESQYDEAERRFKVLEQNIERSKLATEAAQKGLEIAKLESKRVIGSVDDNEYMREAYKAEIAYLEAQLNVLRKDLEKTEIQAPVSGPILEKYVDDRRVLLAGTPLLKMGDLASMEIECDVLSEEVGRVRVGNPVEIIGKAVQQREEGTTPANPNNAEDRFLPGAVKRVYPSAFMKISSLGIEQQRVKTLIDFDNRGLHLRAGTRVDVRIITDAHDKVLAVPERATFRRRNQWYVFVAHDGKARLTPVVLGLKNDQWAEIMSGLARVDTIVTEPKNDLEDGMRVAPKA